jgi:serine/threonine protein kinase
MDNENTFKFIDQGGYGCVFRPEIICDTNEIGSTDYISKIYRSGENINDSDTQKEIAISNIIKKIPNYTSFFAPIVQTCPVNIKEYKSKHINEIEKCDVLYDIKQDKKGNTVSRTMLENDIYYSAKMRFIPNKLDRELSYLVENILEDDFVRKMEQSFQHIDIGLQKCYTAGFIHYDIKPDNILYDDSVHAPIIIDYGITVLIEDLIIATETMSRKQLENIFYTNKYYYYWCIDIFVISQFLYLYDEKTPETAEKVITENTMKNILNLYMENYSNNHKPTPEEVTVLYEKYWGFYSQFVGKHWTDILKKCMEQKWYQTWDYYSLCISYLNIYKILSKRRVYLTENKRMQEMVEKWKVGVFSSDPTKRRSA